MPLIDWQRPWLAPLRPSGEAAAGAWQAGAEVAQACTAPPIGRSAGPPPASQAQALPRFVPAAALPPEEAYEAFIARTGQVPTRNNLHDFFNALMWRQQPAIKWRLNQLQAAQIARWGKTGPRGAVRDALTLFDESGALLTGPVALIDALRRRDWQRLFISQRALWSQARLQLFGHALLEGLASAPRKGLCAHVLVVDGLVVDALQQTVLDMSPDDWATKPFLPLPVLGVPGWWPANEDPAFYDDPAVFRPARSLQSTGSARRCRN